MGSVTHQKGPPPLSLHKPSSHSRIAGPADQVRTRWQVAGDRWQGLRIL